MTTRTQLQKVGDYARIDATRLPALEPCPCCGSAAEAWRYKESAEVSTVAICCSNGDPIGPQEDSGGITSTGCVLYMPPSEFYRERIKSAAEYWNRYARSISAMRRKKNWERASPLRSDDRQRSE